MTDDDKLQALANAIGDLCTALDPTTERQAPLTLEMRAARRARQALKDAGFTWLSRADLVDPHFEHHDRDS